MSDREGAANGMNEEAEVGNTSGTNDPTHDEIHRVADYWQKVEALACRHEAIIHTHDSVECSSCGRPVRVLSDVQIEDLKDRARREPLDPADSTMRETIARALGEHGKWAWGINCDCGEFVPDADVNTHLADAVLAALIQTRNANAK